MVTCITYLNETEEILLARKTVITGNWYTLIEKQLLTVTLHSTFLDKGIMKYHIIS